MLTKEQKLAIANLNRALKRVAKEGIMICGMDSSLYFATNKLRKKMSNKGSCPYNGDYCPTAIANISPEYDDSGGW